MKPFTTVAIAIFTLVSLTHLCRIFTGWEVTVAGLGKRMRLGASGVGG